MLWVGVWSQVRGYSDFCLLQGLGRDPDFKTPKIPTKFGIPQKYLPFSSYPKKCQDFSEPKLSTMLSMFTYEHVYLDLIEQKMDETFD